MALSWLNLPCALKAIVEESGLGKLVPCYAISSKMLFVPVNAAQFVPPTGIFETVGGGFPVFFPVPTETGFGSRARPRAQGRRDIPSQLMESRW